jgi:hypothetical protein
MYVMLRKVYGHDRDEVTGHWTTQHNEELYDEDRQMHHSFNVLVLNTLPHVSAFQNAIIRESNMNMLIWCPMS